MSGMCDKDLNYPPDRKILLSSKLKPLQKALSIYLGSMVAGIFASAQVNQTDCE